MPKPHNAHVNGDQRGQLQLLKRPRHSYIENLVLVYQIPFLWKLEDPDLA